jgi:hypothetical protein
MPVTPTLGRLRQENLEFEANLGCIGEWFFDIIKYVPDTTVCAVLYMITDSGRLCLATMLQ